jgi:ParB family chromosome partitioning protein
MARQSLGRGLSALIGEDTKSLVRDTGEEIDIDLIEPNPEQPRSRFGETELESLAASIRANGIVQPIVVRPKGGHYQIVAGERRWRAAQRAGQRRVPAIIKDIPDEKLLELALVENIQRQELNPIEEAKAYRKLIESVGLTQEQVAERVGKERTLITTTMRLLKLPSDVQRHIIEGKLSLSHGRALLMTDDQIAQRLIANRIVAEDLSVRETERAVKRLDGKARRTTSNRPASADPNVLSAETKLARRFSTKVRIIQSTGRAGGRIEIEYYGVEDLNRIYQIMMGN